MPGKPPNHCPRSIETLRSRGDSCPRLLPFRRAARISLRSDAAKGSSIVVAPSLLFFIGSGPLSLSSEGADGTSGGGGGLVEARPLTMLKSTAELVDTLFRLANWTASLAPLLAGVLGFSMVGGARRGLLVP